MRFLALTIRINDEVPSYREGIMKEIGNWFLDKGYYYSLILDKTTKPLGIYFFETNEGEIKLSMEECKKFLEQYK
jgi:hypothetical protein